MPGLYAIFDKQLSAYLDVFQAPTDAVAVRSFADLVRHQQQTPIAQHPEDYHLSRVATWEPSTGTVTATEPKKLVDALSFKQE